MSSGHNHLKGNGSTFSAQAIWVVIAVVIAVRVLLGVYFASAHGGVPTVLRGHDGGEYLAYASALADGRLADVPEMSRRHNPGWPMLMAMVSVVCGKMVPIAWGAWGLMLVAMSATLGLCYRLMERLTEVADSVTCAWLCVAIGLGYPTLVYYESFALVESVLIFFTVATVYAWLSGRYVIAVIALCAVTLVRSPVWLIGPALLVGSAIAENKFVTWANLLKGIGLLIPLLILFSIMQLCRQAWGGSFIDIHKPVFGFPGMGLKGIGAVGAIRACYILGSLLVVCCGFAMLFLRSRKLGHSSPLELSACIFGITFILFHLCMKSLLYKGAEIPLFNYQDRYVSVLWPFVTLGFAPWLKRPLIVAMVLVSVCLALYWGNHYFAVVAAISETQAGTH